MENQLAVIILNYFGFENTIKCISSVQKVLKSAVFLVDNSADKDERNKLERIFNKTKDIHMLFPSENLGFAAGVNLAINEALKKRFKSFLLLNNDTILLDGLEKRLKKAFTKWPTSLIAPTIRWNAHINKGNYYHKYFGFIVNNKIPKFGSWLYYFTGCALAFDRTFLDKVGYLNEKFFMYGEDVELTLRAQQKGVPLILLEDELVYHAGSQSSNMASFFYEYHMTRMHYLLCFMLLRNPLRQAFSLLTKILILTFRACIRCIRYKNLASLKALFLAPIPLKIRPDRS